MPRVGINPSMCAGWEYSMEQQQFVLVTLSFLLMSSGFSLEKEYIHTVGL